MIHTRPRGFTLIELMIIVVIVAILAAIAYPTYQNQVRKSKREEGKQALLENSQALERCFTRYGAYNNAACQAFSQFVGTVTSDNGYYTLTFTGIAASAFTLQAVPTAPFTDAECGTLTVAHTGATTPVNPVCWR